MYRQAGQHGDAGAFQKIPNCGGLRDRAANRIGRSDQADGIFSQQIEKHPRCDDENRRALEWTRAGFDGSAARVARRRPQNGERSARECIWERRRNRGRHTCHSFVAEVAADKTCRAGKDRAGLDEARTASALDELESLAHLAWTTPLLRPQAGLRPLRNFAPVPEWKDFFANGTSPAGGRGRLKLTRSSRFRLGLSRARGPFAQALKLLLEFFQLLVGKFFEIEQIVPRAAKRTNQLVEFQMKCFSVAVLRVLNQEHHQESNDGGACVDDELPRVGIMKRRPRQGPNNDDRNRNRECPRTAQNGGTLSRQDMKCVLHATDEAGVV